MLQITLPDGTLREFDQPLSVSELASSIGLGLARAAVAGRVNGSLVDCAFVIRHNARVGIVTAREPEGLEILRRSCALLLAMAIKQLHARARILAGSVVGDGFYCEFSHTRALHPDDLRLIEARMYALALANHSIRHVLALYQLAHCATVGLGPHAPSTSVLRAFSLAHVNGSARQRIYGVCWTDQQELDAWRAPQQAMVVSVDERQIEYTQSVTDALRRAGVRANSDVRNEKIADKIRQHCSQAVPYLLVVGEREAAGDFVSLRSGEGEDLGQMNLAAACERLRENTLAREGAAP